MCSEFCTHSFSLYIPCFRQDYANMSIYRTSPLTPSNGSQILSYPLLGKECSFFQCSQFEVCDHQQQWWHSTALEHWEQSLWTNLHGSLSEILRWYIRKGAIEPSWSVSQIHLRVFEYIRYWQTIWYNSVQWFWVDVSILYIARGPNISVSNHQTCICGGYLTCNRLLQKDVGHSWSIFQGTFIQVSSW